MDPAQTPDGGSRCTVQTCLDIIGPLVLRLLLAPNGTDVPVGEVVVAGPGDPLPPIESALLLLVGARGESAAALRLLERAGELGYAGVVVRELDPQDVATVTEEARRCSVALIETGEATSWQHLSNLLAASIAIGSVSDDDVGAGVADLFSLANSIAGQVGGAVTIEDPRGHVLAYSSVPGQPIDDRRRDSIVGRHTPERPENTQEYRAVIQARGRAVRFDFPGSQDEASRLAVAVFAGHEAVGLIFALDHDQSLDASAAARLEEAGRLTALHLLRNRAQQHPQRWAEAEALRALLDGVAPSASGVDRLGELGRRASRVLAVSGQSSDLSLTRVPDLVGVQCRSWSSSCVTAQIGGRTYVLVPSSPEADEHDPALRRFVTGLVGTLARSSGVQVHVAIGPTAPTVHDITLSRRVADRILTVMSRRPGVTVADLADVRSAIVLDEIAEREARMLAYYGGPADQLIEHDARHGTEYAATLLAHLESFGRTDVAARRLLVHENTLRYRIRRLSESFNITFDDPDDRLLAWLQLRMHFDRQPPRPAPVAGDKSG